MTPRTGTAGPLKRIWRGHAAKVVATSPSTNTQVVHSGDIPPKKSRDMPSWRAACAITAGISSAVAERTSTFGMAASLKPSLPGVCPGD